MLDDVRWSLFQNKISSNMFNAKVWIFHVGLVWWGISSNIHKFLLISNVCKFELEFLTEFRFNHKYLSWMRKVQDHVLQKRVTRYTRYDRESCRKPSERKIYCKKGQRREGKGEEHCKKYQIKRRKGLDGWGNTSADRYVRRKTLFVGRFWQRVYETGRQRNSLYGDSKFFGYKHRTHQSKN